MFAVVDVGVVDYVLVGGAFCFPIGEVVLPS
jgi:hypothetical protein